MDRPWRARLEDRDQASHADAAQARRRCPRPRRGAVARAQSWHAHRVSWNRREVLGALGVGSASTLLWALGCAAPAKLTVRTPQQASGEVRGWLRDAVARLALRYPVVHVLAVSRRRTTGAVDLVGTGVARARRDGVVLTVRDRDGMWREQISANLSADGVRDA